MSAGQLAEGHAMRMTTGLLLAAALMGVAGGPAPAAQLLPVAMHGFHVPHTLPNPTPLHVCRVLKRYGGGTCTSPPYAPLGRHCTCEGPHGPRPGVVTWR